MVQKIRVDDMRSELPSSIPEDTYVAQLDSAGLGRPSFVVGVQHHQGPPVEIMLEYHIGNERHRRAWRLAESSGKRKVLAYRLTEDSSSAGYVTQQLA